TADLDRGGDDRAGLHADEHGAVAEPLADAHPTPRADVADELTELGDRLHRVARAFGFEERGRPAQVDEAERADHHARTGVVEQRSWRLDAGAPPRLGPVFARRAEPVILRARR